MKILLIGILEESSVIHCGYANAAMGIFHVLNRMEKEKQIKLVDKLNINDIFSIKMEKQYDIAIVFSHPGAFINPAFKNKFKEILSFCNKSYLSIVWETIPLPTVWNWLWEDKLFDGFVSPSNFVINLIKQMTSKSIYYLPHFIDTDFISRVDINKKLKEEKFTALFMGQYTKRKGIYEAIISFVRAFCEKADTQLILKYHNMSDKSIPINQYVKSIIQTNSLKWNSSIYVIEDKIDFKDIINLYKYSSVFINCSRGEGFGLCSAESMSIGIPVIYTNWSSLPEVSNGKGNIPIDYVLDSSVDMVEHGYELNSFYAIPHIKGIENALLKKYNFWKKDKKGYYEEVSENYKIIREKFGYKKIKNYIFKIIEGKTE